MFKKLNTISSNIILTSIPDNPRGSLAKELYEEVDDEIKEDFECIENPIEAYKKAIEKAKKITVCCGSFYLLIKLKEGLDEKK